VPQSHELFAVGCRSYFADCVALAKTGGEASYTELISCMEMARDVRKLHENANSLPEQNIPSAPVGHRQPTSR
jgi:hypothetical protein